MQVATFILFLSLSLVFPNATHRPADDGQYMDGLVSKRFGVYVDITAENVDHITSWPSKKQVVTICVPKKSKTKTKTTSKKKKQEPIEYEPICKAVVYDVDVPNRTIEIQLTESFDAAASKKGYTDVKMKKDQPIRLIWDNYSEE